MPVASFQTRRGKVRMGSQLENATVATRFNRNLPFKKRSKKGRIEPDFSSNNESNTASATSTNTSNKPSGLSEEELQKRMWKYKPVSEDNPVGAPVCDSSFATRYPEHREPYIRGIASKLETFLKKYGVKLSINYSQCSFSVTTSKRMFDPYAVVKARDMIRLIARYVPMEHAQKVMGDEVFSDIIEIGKSSVARNQVRFIKRRSRLIGPNGVTLRAIELLSKCYVLVYGRTVCVIGSHKGLGMVRRIAMDCMRNVHPIYQLKRLMVEQELAGNPQLKDASWDRFLPSFKRIRRNNASRKAGAGKTVQQIKKDANKKKNKSRNKYTPWPPAPTPSKVDLAMESGAFWNKEWRKDNLRRRSAEEKLKNTKVKVDVQRREKKEEIKVKYKTARRIQKEMRFVPPQERDGKKMDKTLKTSGGRDKGNYIKGQEFRQNLDRMAEQKKRNANKKQGVAKLVV